MGANLYQRYIKVMKDCGYIQKQGRNDFHKYNYAAAAQVLEKVNESCVENGIATIAIPEVISVETPTNRSGAQENRVTVHMAVTLVNIDDPKESMTLHGIGCGQDAGDKAVMKAQTAAIKYAWMMGLQISTGDDPEADTEVDKRMHGEQKKKGTPQATPQATPQVVSLREEKGFDVEAAEKAIAQRKKEMAQEKWARVMELRDSLGWNSKELGDFVMKHIKKKSSECDAMDITVIESLLEAELEAKDKQEVA